MVQWTIAAINEAIERDLEGFVAASEDNYTDQVMAVAMQIRNVRHERPFILVSGPSGSGKTTTALRIETLLDDWDCETATVSLDNYFLPHNAGTLPLDENGDPDYEAPDRLDIELLQKHLKAIYRCEPVEVPRFDFATQSRLPGDLLKRKPGELLLIEGIHTLNPHVMGDCLDYATDVYVSVEDEIVMKSGAIVTPAKLRLMRRLVRDRLFRGSDVANTLDRYLSVSRGERRHITPFSLNADESINTFLPYEFAVYSGLLRDVVDKLPEDLAELVREISPVQAGVSPIDSLVREVCGGRRTKKLKERPQGQPPAVAQERGKGKAGRHLLPPCARCKKTLMTPPSLRGALAKPPFRKFLGACGA